MKTKNINYININHIILAILFTTGCAFLFLTFYFSIYGFDLTDEGFYINSIAFPSLYTKNITFFGFAYHPIFMILNKNWVLMRQVNISIIFSLSWILTFFLIKKYFEKTSSFIELVILSFSFSILSFVYFTTFNWLIAPSYNSLNLTGFLIVSIGLILLEEHKRLKNIFFYFLIVFGWYLSFLAKIPSFLVLVIYSSFYLFWTKKIKIKQFIILGLFISCLIGFTILKINSNPNVLILGMFEEVKNYKLLAKNSSFRFDFFIPGKKDLITIIIIFCILNIYYLLKNNKYKYLLFISSYFFYLIIKDIKDNFLNNYEHIFLAREIDFSFFTIIIIFILILNNSFLNIKKLFKKNEYILIIYFFLLPYVYTFGTGNLYWFQSQMAGYFWILSSICLLSAFNKEEDNFLLKYYPILILGFIFLFMFYCRSLHNPYRQEAFVINNYKYKEMKINNTSSLKVSNEFKRCIINLRKKLVYQTANKQINLVDFSGTPGLVYILNAIPVGAPWLFQGYENSDIYIYNKINSILDRDKFKIWFLFKGDIEEIKNKKLLKMLNINLTKEYKEMVSQKCNIPGYQIDTVYRIFKHV